jgi:hypothetical protein
LGHHNQKCGCIKNQFGNHKFIIKTTIELKIWKIIKIYNIAKKKCHVYNGDIENASTLNKNWKKLYRKSIRTGVKKNCLKI